MTGGIVMVDDVTTKEANMLAACDGQRHNPTPIIL